MKKNLFLLIIVPALAFSCLEATAKKSKSVDVIITVVDSTEKPYGGAEIGLRLNSKDDVHRLAICFLPDKQVSLNDGSIKFTIKYTARSFVNTGAFTNDPDVDLIIDKKKYPILKLVPTSPDNLNYYQDNNSSWTFKIGFSDKEVRIMLYLYEVRTEKHDSLELKKQTSDPIIENPSGTQRGTKNKKMSDSPGRQVSVVTPKTPASDPSPSGSEKLDHKKTEENINTQGQVQPYVSEKKIHDEVIDARKQEESKIGVTNNNKIIQTQINNPQYVSHSVTSNSMFYFNFNSVSLNDSDTEMLTKIVNSISTDTQLIIIGHADDQGSAEYNFHLAEMRASNVALFLGKKGVDIRNALIYSLGENDPKAAGQSEDARRINRCVEVITLQYLISKSALNTQ